MKNSDLNMSEYNKIINNFYLLNILLKNNNLKDK
jgi:hypothetical protein